jgi:lipoate-protein ligase B
VHKYVRDLEAVLIRTMKDFGIEAFRIEGLTGVHTCDGKIAAIGIHIKRWVTTHGFALNVNTDLSFFDFIIACEGEPVTSMEKFWDASLIWWKSKTESLKISLKCSIIKYRKNQQKPNPSEITSEKVKQATADRLSRILKS